mgnify:CR=1 FL=1
MGCAPSKPKEKKGKLTGNKMTDAMKSGKEFVHNANPKNVKEVYDIGNTLGTGGYAVVKRARHKETKKEFAVKIMRPDLKKVRQNRGQNTQATRAGGGTPRG